MAFIGVDFGLTHDLTNRLPDQWRDFNREFIPIHQAKNPGASKISAGLACGAIWTVCKGLRDGDIVLSPDGAGSYLVGEMVGPYQYRPGHILPHRRPVRWFQETISRADMSEALRNSTGSIGTVSDISRYRDELETLIAGKTPATIVAADETIEDAATFALERHLEDFLVQNWAQTELGRDYVIYQEDGEAVGQQFQTDTGPIDILAVRKDKKELLVVELKKGRASDAVVGQVLRYMGYVQEELAENGQSVRGVIIALEDDQRLRRALVMTPGISFYRYEVSFKLRKA